MSEPPAPTRVTVSMLAAEPDIVRDVFERLEGLEWLRRQAGTDDPEE